MFAALVAAWLTAPRWASLLRAPLPETEESGGEEPLAEPTPGAEPVEEASPERRISVKLYLEDPERLLLVPAERSIPFAESLAEQVRLVVDELARSSPGGLLSPLPEGSRVLDVFVRSGGVVLIHLSGDTAAGPGLGSTGELLSVYSIVNSVVGNFPAASRVQIVIDGRSDGTFAGHIDVSRPLLPDLALIAPDLAATTSVEGAPGPAPPEP
jgi:hypothetical protein